ncbi:hypothetical protein OF83DRAFT_478897 [Amylostereum chailletii]|nr:hypothetical protein OF83DRAFT_478897 [Amylostereum chailletii]
MDSDVSTCSQTCRPRATTVTPTKSNRMTRSTHGDCSSRNRPRQDARRASSESPRTLRRLTSDTSDTSHRPTTSPARGSMRTLTGKNGDKCACQLPAGAGLGRKEASRPGLLSSEWDRRSQWIAKTHITYRSRARSKECSEGRRRAKNRGRGPRLALGAQRKCREMGKAQAGRPGRCQG